MSANGAERALATGPRPLAMAISALLLHAAMAGETHAQAFPPDISLRSLSGTNGFRLDGEATYDRSGGSVSAAGDINGDGIDDLIIGAPGANPDNTYNAGSSYVVFGKNTASEGEFPAALALGDFTGTDGFRLDGQGANDDSGGSVSAAGDINGDGIDDLIIGAAGANPNGSSFDAGSSYVVFGKNTATEGQFPGSLALGDLRGTDGFRLDGESVERSGRSVSTAGDINGDGIDDLIVGAPGAWPNGTPNAGSSYVVFGKNTATEGAFPATLALGSLSGSDGFRLDGEAGNNSGQSVSAAGDLNGDGIDDLIIGAPNANPNGVTSAGSSYVVFGKNTGTEGEFPASLALGSLNGTDGFRLDGEARAYDRSGTAVSGAGDINGDGTDDLIVGAPRADPDGTDEAGSSYVVFGKNTASEGEFPAALALGDLTGTDGFRLDGGDPSDESGRSVSAAGDINGDGIDDLIVGADGADSGIYAAAGNSYVVFGRDTATEGEFAATIALGDLTGSNGFRLDGDRFLDRSGGSVSAAGDINGDGIDDLIIGASGADPSENSEAGSSYVVFGGIGGPGEIPELNLTPANLDFGDVMIGGVVGATLIVENTGTGLLETGSLSLQGMHAGDFSIEQNSCAGAQLAGGEFCDIEVGFSPTAPGIREATLRAESNALSSPDRAALRGSNDVVFADEFE